MTTTVSATAQELKETAEDARKAIVDLHGEMVLLLNYSAINYTGCFHLSTQHNLPGAPSLSCGAVAAKQ